MELLSRFVEEIRLGVVHNPHTDRPMLLTEMVTVCPACHSLHSLRQKGVVVSCVECGWVASVLERASAA